MGHVLARRCCVHFRERELAADVRCFPVDGSKMGCKYVHTSFLIPPRTIVYNFDTLLPWWVLRAVFLSSSSTRTGTNSLLLLFAVVLAHTPSGIFSHLTLEINGGVCTTAGVQ